MSKIVTKKQLMYWLIFGAFMLLIPLWTSGGTLRIFVFANYLAIFAMSWDMLSGRTGYVSFGHPFLIGIGAYASAILSKRYGVPVELSILLAVLFTMVGGLLVFLPALRVKGSYFALVTLAMMELAYQLTQVIRPDLTGGTRGISGVETLTRGAQNAYYLSFSLMFVIGFFAWLILRTQLGVALSAVGMQEESINGSGLSSNRVKLAAFLISAFMAGLGGAFYVHYVGSIAPRTLFDINFLFTMLVAALIGGAGTIIGPIIGAYFLTFLLEYLRPYLPGTERYFVYGLISLIIYMYQPKGMVAIFEKLSDKLRGRST